MWRDIYLSLNQKHLSTLQRIVACGLWTGQMFDTTVMTVTSLVWHKQLYSFVYTQQASLYDRLLTLALEFSGFLICFDIDSPRQLNVYVDIIFIWWIHIRVQFSRFFNCIVLIFQLWIELCCLKINKRDNQSNPLSHISR